MMDSPKPFERERPGFPFLLSHSLRRVSGASQLKATAIRAQDTEDFLKSHVNFSSIVIIQSQSFHNTAQPPQ